MADSEPLPQAATTVVIHQPNATTIDNFDVDAFMGKWNVTHSTLPLWKNKKDVTITYTPIEPKGKPVKFNDLVEYRSQKAAPTSKPSRVEGVDTLISARVEGAGSPAPRYKWRGKGLLMIASSRWQVLGFGERWAVTFFEKTLFTPMGIDIYSRDEKGLPAELVADIVEKTKALGGEVGKLAEQIFQVGK